MSRQVKMMKNALAIVFAFGLISAALAHSDAGARGCAKSNNRTAGCTVSVTTPASDPEPRTLMFLGSGLIALSVFLRRQKRS